MLPCIPKRSRFLGETDIKAQRIVSKEIDKFMKKEKRKLQSRHSILLLGTGESGKSTFLKQMKLINGKSFTNDELARFKDTIYDNIYKGILFLIDAQRKMEIPLENEDKTMEAGDKIEEYFKIHKNEHKSKSVAGEIIWTEEEFLSLVEDITTVWKDKGIKEAFENRAKMTTESFSENTRFYLNRIDKIGMENYKPTNEDIVWSRKPTDSIIEEEIIFQGSSLIFIDVGGQTKERKKWCQVFQDMNSVLFLIASSHFDEHYYDRMSRENRNKLREAMRVFEDLINVQYFLSVSVIIFFNKTDVLTEKVQNRISNIREEFEEYPTNYDPHDLQHVQQFLVDTFVSFVDNPGLHNHQNNKVSSPTNNNNPNSSSISRLSLGQAQNAQYLRQSQQNAPTSAPTMPVRKRTLYRHFTTAIDRKNIETVFNAMKDTILQRNIDQLVMK